MNVLIVSRTRMKNGVCCGGLNLQNGEFVRILSARGGHLPSNAPFQIGQVYDMVYQTAWNVRSYPHIEDKQVLSYRFQKQLSTSELIRNIDSVVRVQRGGLQTIFNGKLKHSSYAAYISPDDVPDYSVTFWRPDIALNRIVFMGKVRYRFNNHNISYVGYQDPLAIIPPGTLLRMSLANWWSPDDITEKRCYLQLSGWYL